MTLGFALSGLALYYLANTTTFNVSLVFAMWGATGANAGGEACTKKCVAAGEKLVVVTDGDSKVIAVDNQDAVKDHAGHHVAVTGTVTNNVIHVNSVKML